MTAILDRVRCAICRCKIDDVDDDEAPREMFRVRPYRSPSFFLCGDCLRSDPAAHIDGVMAMAR